jgi:hypothetical protein
LRSHKGYVVLTSDDERLGEVIDESGGNLVVQHGLLFKHRRALPMAFAHVDDTEQVVRTTLSKQMIVDSPDLKEHEPPDEQEIAAYYGLAEFDSPPAAAYEDAALSAEHVDRRLGRTPPEEERARVREGAEDVYGPPGRQLHPPNPHVTGGPDSSKR